MTQISAEHDLVSIGNLAAQLQRPLRAIESAAIDLEIIPALRINHVPHFDANQAEKLRANLQRGQK